MTPPDATTLVRMLEPPSGPQDMVLDTDTYNEIDDQYALVYALLSDELNVQAVYAAPFHNDRSEGPGDGMRKSHEEILRLLDRLGISPDGLVHTGSEQFMAGAATPVASPAAADLVRRAMDRKAETPLYVLAIGAPTNVSSAIVMEPAIREKIVVVWLGGNAHTWRTAREFNLMQDMHASRLLFDSGVPLVQIPCMGGAELLRTTAPEIDHDVAGRGPIGDYLAEIYHDYVPAGPGRSKVIWDIANIGFMVNPGWVRSALVPSPILTDQLTYSQNPMRHPIRVAWHLDRDAIFADLFTKLERATGEQV